MKLGRRVELETKLMQEMKPYVKWKQRCDGFMVLAGLERGTIGRGRWADKLQWRKMSRETFLHYLSVFKHGRLKKKRPQYDLRNSVIADGLNRSLLAEAAKPW